MGSIYVLTKALNIHGIFYGHDTHDPGYDDITYDDGYGDGSAGGLDDRYFFSDGYGYGIDNGKDNGDGHGVSHKVFVVSLGGG